MKQIFVLLLASGSFCFAQQHHGMPRDSRPTPTPRPPPSRFVEPNFLLPANPDVSDYRPVLNAEGTMVIFERNPTATPTDVKLYIADLSTGNVQRFVNFASARADWCWNRSGGGLTSGPVAFSNGDGIYRVDAGGQPVLLPDTAGMIYPSWYPNCQHLAVDVTGAQVTAEIDATTGQVIISPLANETVWAGFASVNQTNPNLISFAGQLQCREQLLQSGSQLHLGHRQVDDTSHGRTDGSQCAERRGIPAKISSPCRMVVTRWQMVRLRV